MCLLFNYLFVCYHCSGLLSCSMIPMNQFSWFIWLKSSDAGVIDHCIYFLTLTLLSLLASLLFFFLDLIVLYVTLRIMHFFFHLLSWTIWFFPAFGRTVEAPPYVSEKNFFLRLPLPFRSLTFSSLNYHAQFRSKEGEAWKESQRFSIQLKAKKAVIFISIT